MDPNHLVVETKLYNLSTRGSACNILNDDPNFKSKCEYNIADMIVRDEFTEYIQFSVPCAQIPVSFFIINDTNNQLVVRVNSVATTYVFPYGNYNANTFIAQFKILLGANFTLSLATVTNFFTITSSLNFTILGSSSVSSVMGFSKDFQGVQIQGGSSYIATCSRCCNFLSLPRISLRCAELSNGTMVGSSTSSDLLVVIPNNSKANGQIYFQNQSQSRVLFRHNELSRFTVSLTDDDGNLLNFNGISSFFTFQFDIYRKFVPKPESFRKIVDKVNNYEYPDNGFE